MTALDRFDPFAGRVFSALEEIAPASRPAYLDDRPRGRPRARDSGPAGPSSEGGSPWTPRSREAPGWLRGPVRPLLLLLLLAALLAAAAALYVGSQRRVPAPYGPADNGGLVYGLNGDLYVRDSLDGQPRLLLGGPGEQGGALFSFDGQLVAYDHVVDGVDRVAVANADGSNPRVILDAPFTGNSAAWSPDSRSMALTIKNADGAFELWIAPADGSGAREVEVDGLSALDVVYNPADDGTLLIRGLDRLQTVDLYLIDLQGHVVRRYGLPGDMLYGADYEFAGLAFSPDGRTIAYNSVEPGDRFRAQLVDVDGTNQRPVPAPADAPADSYSQAWPAFSPDGRWVAMESWAGAIGGDVTNQLAIAPADGSAPARLVGPSVAEPDGRQGVVARRHEGAVRRPRSATLYEADPVTGEWRQLPWNSELPDWQRGAH